MIGAAPIGLLHDRVGRYPFSSPALFDRAGRDHEPVSLLCVHSCAWQMADMMTIMLCTSPFAIASPHCVLWQTNTGLDGEDDLFFAATRTVRKPTRRVASCCRVTVMCLFSDEGTVFSRAPIGCATNLASVRPGTEYITLVVATGSSDNRSVPWENPGHSILPST